MQFVTPLAIETPRQIFLGDVDDKSTVETLTLINKINAEDEKNEAIYKNYVREPIILNINSYGGCVYDGFAIISAIESSVTPVTTRVLGKSMSMAFLITLFGDHRQAMQYSTLMLHDVSSAAWDKVEDMIDDVKEAKRLRAILKKMIIERTKITAEEFDEMIATRRDWTMSAKEALRLGIVDELI